MPAHQSLSLHDGEAGDHRVFAVLHIETYDVARAAETFVASDECLDLAAFEESITV